MTATIALIVEQVAIDQLRPDPANPRCIGQDEFDSLERSIRQFGFVQPVLARREGGTVIGGHQRLVAARRLGLAAVPVTYLDLSVEQARVLSLALNKISGSWDDTLLARMLADLAASEADLTLSGFGQDELATLLRSLEVRDKADKPEDFDLETALEDAGRTQRSNRLGR
jgi:ParB-like chromosome segregation protein Spo0J